MEETISTTVETSEGQTTPDVTENQTIETTEENSNVQPEDVQEPDKTEVETTGTEPIGEEGKQEPRSAKAPADAKNWEQIAKDNQASFTRVSQELAELKKQIEAQKPKIVEEGKINPQYEQQYKFSVDNREFLAYDNLTRRLEPETRAEVENLLREAQRLYDPKNTRAYEAKMAQVKDYFKSDIVEEIANNKQQLLGQMREEFNRKLQEDRNQRANLAAQEIEKEPELYELVDENNENFAPEVLGIISTMFEQMGSVDVNLAKGAIEKIKALGVKQYLAKQNAESEKQKAVVPSGKADIQKTADIEPTAELASKNYDKYIDSYMKKGLSFSNNYFKMRV